MDKTNAMRMLDKAGISYEALGYPSNSEALDAVTVAGLLNVAPERVFKTLVLQGHDQAFYVCVIPGQAELDLKKAAAAFKVKSLRMLHVDEIRPVTGYVRGGCSPIGMKKRLRTAVDESALIQPCILVSAGVIGAQIKLRPEDLFKVCGALSTNLVRDSSA